MRDGVVSTSWQDEPMRIPKVPFIVFASVIVGLLSLAGCDRVEPSETAGMQAVDGPNHGAREEESNGAHYSAFGIRLQNGEKFKIISFKDVGLGRKDPQPSDKLLETIAQSLAYQLQLDQTLNLEPVVFYDTSLADPAEHKYCEKDRLYVDVWRGRSPSRWGYSLWSGCSMRQRFEWREVETDLASSEEVDEAVEPLTEGIVQSLSEATESNCFQKTC